MGAAVGVYVFLSGFLMFADPYVLGGIRRLTGIELSHLSIFVITFASAMAAADAYKTFSEDDVPGDPVAFKLSCTLLVVHGIFWTIVTMITRRGFSVLGNDYGSSAWLVLTVMMAVSFVLIFLGVLFGLRRKTKSRG